MKSILHEINDYINSIVASVDPIAQISVDDSRHIVYTRSEKGTIAVYDLGNDGWGMSSTVALSLGYILRQATYIAR